MQFRYIFIAQVFTKDPSVHTYDLLLCLKWFGAYSCS